MGILDLLGKKIIFFDGATGTYLQEHGLKPGELPEYMNITDSQTIINMHKGFLNAGCDIILTNTFGANHLKYNTEEYSVEKIIKKAVENAKVARRETVGEKNAYISLDIGPTGKLLKPMGDLEFEEAYELFKEMVVAGEKYGVDLITIETMSDMYELKAAILAAKENSSLPVFATVIFDEKGKLLTGGTIQSAVAVMEALGVDALGVNCGLGPQEMKPIVAEILSYASIPVIVNPNAGLPRSVDGQTVFDVTPEQFAETMSEIAHQGAWIIGGCCGTKASHIAKMIELCKSIIPKPFEAKTHTIVTSYAKSVELGNDPKIIGERINPTGKSKFKQALRDNDFDYILREGLTQQEKGAHILDVNVGLPEINEPKMMEEVIQKLQAIIDLPLQIDTTNYDAMERAMRIYNGKPMINSVSGKKEVMEKIFPLVKKYGGVVVGLTLDEDGIPKTAQKRFDIAKKIIDTAQKYGIKKKDIVIDVLAMTISSEKLGAITTLEALEMVRTKLDVNTVLGVSNISFGLPQRELINTAFFTLAMEKGLTSAIINPSSEKMMNAYYSYRALAGLDDNCTDYITAISNQDLIPATSLQTSELKLSECVQKGLKDAAHSVTEELVKTLPPLDIINQELIPALDIVGKKFENGILFLPQLLMSADAAKSAFDVIKNVMGKSGNLPEKNGDIVLATVKGDIHDIGKNIVKVLLENYSFNVIDLGKDVPIETIVETVVTNHIKLVGLSALMTTTVTSMEETIKELRKKAPSCIVMVGGAVLTEEYANMIGADKYCKDAMSSVNFAQSVFKC